MPWWIKNKLTFNYKTLTCNVDGSVLPLHGSSCSGALFNLESSTGLPECLEQFSSVFSEQLGTQLPPHRQTDLKIEFMPGKIPSHGRTIQLSAIQSKILKEYLDEQLALGFMSPSTSSCSSPIFFVKKKDGGLRPCVDYRKINDITIKNRYPLPSADVLSDKLSGAAIFSKVDLQSAFNQLRIASGDEWKTAVCTPYGLYEYNVMPFGLCNAPAAFQSFINQVLFSLIDVCIVVYLDDILIYSKNKSDHGKHLQQLFSKLKDNNLFCKLSKCLFYCEEIDFLGYKIKSGSIAIAEDKLQAIQDFPKPKTQKEVRGFLGLANFSRRFIKNFSQVALPLTKLTKTTEKFQWNPQADQAFVTLKQSFLTSPVLMLPDNTKQFVLECDASYFAIGAVLRQEKDGFLHPVAYFSRKLNPAEINYHVFDKELLAIVHSLKHWRRFLEGATHPVLIHTEYKN